MNQRGMLKQETLSSEQMSVWGDQMSMHEFFFFFLSSISFHVLSALLISDQWSFVHLPSLYAWLCVSMATGSDRWPWFCHRHLSRSFCKWVAVFCSTFMTCFIFQWNFYSWIKLKCVKNLIIYTVIVGISEHCFVGEQNFCWFTSVWCDGS